MPLLSALATMLSVACSGCAHRDLPEPALWPGQGSEDVREARRPDGVFLDVEPAAPVRGAVPVPGVVALSLPFSAYDANALLHSYFRAFMGGDATTLGGLLAHGAKRLDDGGSAFDLLRSLERRLRNVDYSRVPVDQVAAYEEARVAPFETLPVREQSESSMQPGDVLLDVPIRIQQVGLVRMFGPRVEIVVRRAGGLGAWQIVAMREADAPWP